MNTRGPSRPSLQSSWDVPAVFPAPPLARGCHAERLPEGHAAGGGKATRRPVSAIQSRVCLEGDELWGKFKGGRYCVSFRQSSVSNVCQLFLDDKPHEDRKHSCSVPSRTGFRVRSLQNRDWAALGLK